MKAGDLVYLLVDEAICPQFTGIIVSERLETGWYDVLLPDGKVIMWPPQQTRPIEEGRLTDQQLEEVQGGMSAETFELWRVEKINENA
jgi:hypothetical protein